MKKGSYWFAFLSEKEQKEFRENCPDFNFRMKREIYSFDYFISSAFSWKKTPQGNEYWLEISNRDVQ